MKKINLLIFGILIFIVLTPLILAYRAPPAPPVVIDGNVTIDNESITEGPKESIYFYYNKTVSGGGNLSLNISLWDGETLVMENITNNFGIFWFVLPNIDNPITHNDDPNCIIYDYCVPCVTGFGPDKCIEGYYEDTVFTMKIDNSSKNISLGIDYTKEILEYIGFADNDGDSYPGDVDCDDSNPNIHPWAQELCNGIDDNCLAGIDENINDTYNGTNVGICQEEIKTCNNGTWEIVQQRIFPELEFENTSMCDGLDNNCDGLIDNDMPQIFNGSIIGTCQPEIKSCINETWQIIQIRIDPSNEFCDGLDTDCDGVLDGNEGFDPKACGESGCEGITFCEDTGYGDCTSKGNVCDSWGAFECSPDELTFAAQYIENMNTQYCGAQGLCDGNVDFESTILDNCTEFQYCSIDNLGCYDSGYDIVLDIDLPLGESLISIPFETDDDTITSVLDSIDGEYLTVQYFNEVYRVGQRSNLNIIEPKKGYRINMNNPANLIVYGTKPNDCSINLQEGWNLVSYMSQTDKTILEALASINYHQVKDTNSILSDSDMMEYGRGYFIYMNESSTLNYPEDIC
jgi:hypothetical protein